jgi:hypothetical protein
MRLRPVLAVTLVLTGLLALPSHAGCGVSGVRGTDPGKAAINAEIDRAAARRKVPPYLLKAIAWHESRWRQFYSDGRVVLSGACAIGVMQVLPRGWDARRLATDYRYNVDAGAQMLAAKMAASSANVPSSLGSDDRRVAENWYRAAYRYNGSGYYAMRFADAIFATVKSPPSELAAYVTPVAVTNPRHVVRGYTPTSGHAYVARLDGTWVSTLGRYQHRVVRGDYLAGEARMRAGRTLEGDQVWASAFAAKNLGWATWSVERVTLSTYPPGRASRLYHPSWRTATRPVRLLAATAPGQEGRFEFKVRAKDPASSITVTERFVPVVDATASLGGYAGSTWTLHPAQNPTARITSAPEYVTDASTTSTAPLKVAWSDPSPGSGVAYVEVGQRAPGATTWAYKRITLPQTRVALRGAGAHVLRVRAVDKAGHRGAWSAERLVVVPRDDTDAALSFEGPWSAASPSGSWLGSLATAAPGASVSVPATGRSYALIGTRGPDVAPLSVYLDGVLVTVVDPVAETTLQRQVLWEGTLPEGDHVLRVVVGDPFADSSGTGHLDAIAVA